MDENNVDLCSEDNTKRTISATRTMTNPVELPSLEPMEDEEVFENGSIQNPVLSIPHDRNLPIIQTVDADKASAVEESMKPKTGEFTKDEETKIHDVTPTRNELGTSRGAAGVDESNTKVGQPDRPKIKVCQIKLHRCDSSIKTVIPRCLSTADKVRNTPDNDKRLSEKGNSQKREHRRKSQRLVVRPNTRRSTRNNKVNKTQPLEAKHNVKGHKVRGRPKKLSERKDIYKYESQREHLRGVKKSKYVCSDCPSKFHRHLQFLKHKMKFHKQITFTKHQLRVKLIKKEVDTDDCKTRSNAQETATQKKDTSKTFRKMPLHFCSLCPAKFKQRKRLLNHKMSKHAPDEFKREQSTSKTSTKIRNTNKIVLKISLHSCSHCPAKFKQQTQLLKHKETKHSSNEFTKQHSCRKCKKSFRVFGTLRKHMKEVHPREMSYPCTWKTCKSSFPNQYRLTRHLQTHTGDKPFKCGKCKNSFVDKWAFMNHERSHSRGRP